jgi:hypothetical protein
MAMATKVEPAGPSAAVSAHGTGVSRIRVGLIDGLRPRREQLIGMLAKTHPDLQVVPFMHIAACIGAAAEGFDVILYCGPDDRSSLAVILESVILLRDSLDIPVVVVHAGELPVQRIAQRPGCGRAETAPAKTRRQPGAD